MTRRVDSKVNGKTSSISLRKEETLLPISIKSIRMKTMMRKKFRLQRRETSNRKTHLIAKRLMQRTTKSSKFLVEAGIQLYQKDSEGAVRRKLRTGRE
jgi:predicted nucleotidyltransferase